MGGCSSAEEEEALPHSGTVAFSDDLRVRFVRKIAEGGYSRVFLVTELSSKRLFALKIMNCGSEELQQLANREVEMLQRFEHPNLIKLIAHKVASNSVGQQESSLLLPFYSLGTLETYVARTPAQCHFLSDSQMRTLFVGMCSGVAELHKAGLVHRDLKPLNILLQKNGPPQDTTEAIVPIICDLGSISDARVVVETNRDALRLQEACDRLCSPLYRAPELFEVMPGTTITEKTDVWALGCILYFMAFGEGPFHQAASQPGASVKLAVVNGRISYPDTQGRISETTVNLMKQLLAKDPEQRPSVEEVLLACSFLPGASVP